MWSPGGCYAIAIGAVKEDKVWKKKDMTSWQVAF